MMNCFTLHGDVSSECIYGEGARNDVDLTIVIPTYKRMDTLTKTVESILRQKTGSLKYQVLIVSNDPEFNLAQLSVPLPENIFSVYRNTKNLGMVGNINRCAYLAKGTYVAYIQDDDVLLDNYLISIEELIDTGELNNLDCLIPNRYYFYNQEDLSGIFGENAYKGEKKKAIMKKLLSLGTRKRMFQRVTKKECAESWYNCFTGGPTCGMVFKRESLMKTNGFPVTYPYAFDYAFFIDFAEKNNVVLYDKCLSIYRMTESASNRPEVQLDFYRSDIYLYNRTKNCVPFVQKYKNEILKFSIENKSQEAQSLIHADVPKVRKYRYYKFRVLRLFKMMRYNLYRHELLPDIYFDYL